jgi:hypothetical protein
LPELPLALVPALPLMPAPLLPAEVPAPPLTPALPAAEAPADAPALMAAPSPPLPHATTKTNEPTQPSETPTFFISDLTPSPVPLAEL